ncbi:MAG TPA: PIN domain-containing protein [Candidatus Acidoferrum sp.]|nr:PIN domain-containing protein [Candidatus Acidoferrum sp.]
MRSVEAGRRKVLCSGSRPRLTIADCRFLHEAVLAEVFYLAEPNIRDARSVWLLLRSGAIQMSPIAHEDLPRIQALMAQYADRPMDFADATLVHAAARERLSSIPVDHDDFETYRLPGRKKFAILPRRTRS